MSKAAAPPEGADDVGGTTGDSTGDLDPDNYSKKGKLKTAAYDAEMARLQEQLVLLQYWIQSQGLRVLVIFEGRGSAGKGGVIKRITERTSPAPSGSWLCPSQQSGRRPSGTSSGTSSTCPPQARWSCSTAVGTTAPTSSG